MKRSKFSPIQIAGMLRKFDGDKTAEEINREHGVSKASLYKWRQRYGGMKATELKRIKELEEENSQPQRNISKVNIFNLRMTEPTRTFL